MNSAGVLQYMDVMLFGSRGFWGLRLHKCWFGIEGIDLVVWGTGSRVWVPDRGRKLVEWVAEQVHFSADACLYDQLFHCYWESVLYRLAAYVLTL